VFLTLGVQHAMCMRHVVICGLADSTVFFSEAYKGHDLKKKKSRCTLMRVLLFSTTFV
jgi:hypothetical protein